MDVGHGWTRGMGGRGVGKAGSLRRAGEGKCLQRGVGTEKENARGEAGEREKKTPGRVGRTSRRQGGLVRRPSRPPCPQAVKRASRRKTGKSPPRPGAASQGMIKAEAGRDGAVIRSILRKRGFGKSRHYAGYCVKGGRRKAGNDAVSCAMKGPDGSGHDALSCVDGASEKAGG